MKYEVELRGHTGTVCLDQEMLRAWMPEALITVMGDEDEDGWVESADGEYRVRMAGDDTPISTPE